MEPTVGRIVHFIVDEKVRDLYCEHKCKAEVDPDLRHPWCHQVGQSLPFIITGVREGGYSPTQEKHIPPRVSGKVIFNGPLENLCLSDIEEGHNPGQWRWPPRV